MNTMNIIKCLIAEKSREIGVDWGGLVWKKE